MKKNSFTLIELLLVVGIIGILSGVILNIINVKQQKNIATDHVNLANMEKAAQAIEAFYTLNLHYPANSDSGNNPLKGLEGSELSKFLSTWPVGLLYAKSDTTGEASIQLQKLAGTDVYKWQSTTGKITECAEGTDADDPASCVSSKQIIIPGPDPGVN